MENLKHSVIQFSKKSSIKSRFFSKKVPESKTSTNASARVGSTTAQAQTSSAQSTTESSVDKMALSVLDLFPDMQTSFIKVKQNIPENFLIINKNL